MPVAQRQAVPRNNRVHMHVVLRSRRHYCENFEVSTSYQNVDKSHDINLGLVDCGMMPHYSTQELRHSTCKHVAMAWTYSRTIFGLDSDNLNISCSRHC
jgi:hypothetical protein